LTLKVDITRDKFESLCGDLFECCLLPVDPVLKEANLSVGGVKCVVLTSGSSLIPRVKKMLSTKFGQGAANQEWIGARFPGYLPAVARSQARRRRRAHRDPTAFADPDNARGETLHDRLRPGASLLTICEGECQITDQNFVSGQVKWDTHRSGSYRWAFCQSGGRSVPGIDRPGRAWSD
jgi:hypothetical protein